MKDYRICGRLKMDRYQSLHWKLRQFWLREKRSICRFFEGGELRILWLISPSSKASNLPYSLFCQRMSRNVLFLLNLIQGV